MYIAINLLYLVATAVSPDSSSESLQEKLRQKDKLLAQLQAHSDKDKEEWRLQLDQLTEQLRQAADYKEQWKDAEQRVARLEGELSRAQQQLMDQITTSQSNAVELREEVEQTRRQLSQGTDTETDLLRSRQDMVDRIIQMGEKVRIIEMGEKMEKVRIIEMGEKVRIIEMGEKVRVIEMGEKVRIIEMGEKVWIIEMEKVRIIEMGEKSKEAESNLSRLQQGTKQLSEEVVDIINNLGDPEQQEMIHGLLRALELENQVLSLRNAQLESSTKHKENDLSLEQKTESLNLRGDSDVGDFTHEAELSSQMSPAQSQVEKYGRVMERHEVVQSDWSQEKLGYERSLSELRQLLAERDESLNVLTAQKGLLDVMKQSSGTEELVSTQLRMKQLDATVDQLTEERAQLKDEQSVLSCELEALSSVVQDLETQLGESRRENVALATSLEELDQQHQEAINQLLGAKTSLQKDYDSLQEELSVAKQHQPTNEKQVADVCVEASEDIDGERLEVELFERVSKLLTFEIPPELEQDKRAAGGKKGTALVSALVKMAAECKWQRATLERKVAELMKELRECAAERAALQGNVETLVEELMVAKANSACTNEGLAPIPENSEEVDALEQKVAALEGEIYTLRETRLNLEVELRKARDEGKGLAQRLQTAEENLGNTAHLQAKAADLRACLEASELQLASERTKLESSEQQLWEAREAVAALEARTEDLEAEATLLEDLKLQLEEAINAKVSVENELIDAICKSKTFELALNGYEQTSAAGGQIEQLLKEKSKLQGEIEEMNSLLQLRNEMQQEVDLLLQKKNDLQAELNSIQTRKDELLLEYTNSQLMIVNAKEKLQETLILNSTVTEQTKQLESRLSHSAEQQEAKDSQLAVARQREAALEAVCQDLQANISIEKQRTQALESTLSNKQLELEENSLGLKILKSEKALLEQHLDKISCPDQNIELRLKDLSSSLAEKERQLSDCNEALMRKERELGDALLSKSVLDAEYQTLLNETGNAKDHDRAQQEVRKWKEMAEAGERQLDEALQARTELEIECRRLFSIETKVHAQEHLEKEVSRLTVALESTEQQLSDVLEEKVDLEGKLNSLSSRLQELEEETQKWKDESSLARQHVQNNRNRTLELQSQCERLALVETNLFQTRDEAIKWRNMYHEVNSELNETKSTLGEMRVECKRLQSLEMQLRGEHTLQQEISQWKETVDVLRGQLEEMFGSKLLLEDELDRRKTGYYEMSGRTISSESGAEKSDIGKEEQASRHESAEKHLKEQVDGLLNQVKNPDGSVDFDVLEEILRKITAEKITLESLLRRREKELEWLNDLAKLRNDDDLKDPELPGDDATEMARETITNLSTLIKEKDLELDALSQKCDTLLDLQRSCEREREQLARLQAEKDELVRTVHVKHQESVQYHAEIQRLTALLSQELSKSEENLQQHKGLVQQFEDRQKMLVNTQNELIAVKQRLQKLEELAKLGETFQGNDTVPVKAPGDDGTLSSHNTIQNNVTPVPCSAAPEPLSQVWALEKRVHDLESDLASKDEVTLSKSELVVRCQEQLQLREQECDTLRAQIQEQREKESALLKELQRLRLHLVGVEEAYTQEALRAEQQLKELQGRLSLAEERIKNSSTVYTSASIRANQQVETLQGQARLIAQHRDDIQQKLSAAEDQVHKHSAALRNLQAVLEQFQKGTATSVSQGARVDVCNRQSETATPGGQLSEAKEGLSAAARLGEQLDKKTETITALKEEDLALLLPDIVVFILYCSSSRGMLTAVIWLVMVKYQLVILGRVFSRCPVYMLILGYCPASSSSVLASRGSFSFFTKALDGSEDDIPWDSEDKDGSEDDTLWDSEDKMAQKMIHRGIVLAATFPTASTCVILPPCDALSSVGQGCQLLRAVKLTQKLTETENKVHSASQSSEGKIDRSLLKNLVLGYFVAPSNSRAEVLRVVATVLDFSQEERKKIGLDGADGGGWFKALLHPGKAGQDTPSLSEAFIRFLESESRPQPQLRLLPDSKSSSASGEENNSANSSPKPGRSPLLLADVQLPTFVQFPVGRNSSSFLKDVLKDS
uniref:GRIP domain-containing protein n=1 Tax=Timema monikensis TaxID=170555 RepID=A0A7R9EAY1_9NEOP|nr:unnamed protein product [Timema monikensis]